MSKNIKNKIAEVESVCQAVFENSMDAILLTAPDGRIFAANPAACEMYGRSQEEIISAGRNGLVDTTDDNLPFLLAERERTGRAFGELRQKRKDGSVFPAEVSSRIFKSPGGDEFTIIIIRDITRKNQNINEIKKAREFAENLIETANVIFIQLDNSGKILKVNKTFENISGYKREDILGKDWFKVLVPKNRFKEVREEFSHIINGQKPRGISGNQILTKTGEERHIQWSHSTLSKEGDVIGTISFGIDVTSQKKAEQALRESELWLNRIFNSVDYALIAVTPERNIIKVNEATERIFGYSKEELLNQSTKILHVDYDHYLEFGKMIREAFDRGESANFEYEAKRKNEEIFPTEHLVSLLKDNKQNEIGIVSFVRDLTEKKRMEEKLFQKENLLHIILQNAPITIFATDNNGIFTLSEGKQLERVNLKPGENVGLSAYDLFGLLPFKDVTGSVLPGKDVLTSALNGNVVTAVNKLKDVHFENHIGPIIDKEGKIAGAVGVAVDITERKLIELKLRKNEAELRKTTKELRALSKHLEDVIENERTQIARDLHDDLGQKLTALNLNISWIKSRMGVQSRNVVDKFNSMIDLINETVKSLHDISYKLRPGVLEDLGLKAAIEWQLSDFSKSTGISSVLSFDSARSIENQEISLCVFRIIQESLTNVARHSKASKVAIDISVENYILNLVIRDNGIGMAKNKIKNYKSFGLIGMRERAKAYNGEFQIKSRKGEGTVITVIIPLDS